MKDDVISRQDAIDAILSKPALHGSDGSYYHADDIRNAVMQLPSAEPERKPGRWIPCSERLPEESGHYLVTMTRKAKEEDTGFDIDEADVRKMRYGNSGWRLPRHFPGWINDALTEEVIAWMPLPEPYKDGGGA